MGNQNIEADGSSYQPPETMEFVYCIAVLNAVLKHNVKSKELFDDIRECLRLPGCQEVFSKLEARIPKREKLVKAIVTKSGYNYKKSPPEDNQATVTRNLLIGSIKLTKVFSKKFMLWVILGSKRRRDFKILWKGIDTFIRVGFNRESEQAEGKYNLTASTSNILAVTVHLKALAETYDVDLDKLGEIPMFKYANKLYSVNTVMDGKLPNKARRSLVSQYVSAGYRLKHDYKIYNIANRWYQCRVVYSGPEEYCHAQRNQPRIREKENLDPANVSNEIRVCDEAIGYTRKKTGKHKD